MKDYVLTKVGELYGVFEQHEDGSQSISPIFNDIDEALAFLKKLTQAENAE